MPRSREQQKRRLRPASAKWSDEPQPAKKAKESDETRGERESSGARLRIPKKSKLSGFSGLSFNFENWKTPLAALIFLFDIYLIASVFTSWTGVWGAGFARVLLALLGGAVLVPLFFIAWLCFSRVARREVGSLFRQTLGTLGLTFCSAYLLGLKALLDTLSSITPAVLGAPKLANVIYPGMFGTRVVAECYETFGPLGAVLIGVAAMLATLYAYGFAAVERLFDPQLWGRVRLFFRSFAERFKRKPRPPKKATPESREDLDEADTAADFEDDFPEEGEEEFEGEAETESEEIDETLIIEETVEADETRADELHEVLSEEPREEPMPPQEAPSGIFEVIEEVAPQAQEVPASQAQAPAAAPEAPAAIPAVQLPQALEFPPPISLYGPAEEGVLPEGEETAQAWGQSVVGSLRQFGIESELADVLIGPTVVQLRIQLAPGVKVSKVSALSNDLALALAVPSLRVEAPIPGQPYVGIEIPNPTRRVPTLRTLLEDETFRKAKCALPLAMGVCVDGKPLVVGLEELPHLLVSGTTGSGKSVFVNCCIVGLCSTCKPEELRLLLIDPKRVEMAVYDNLPHPIKPPITDTKKAVSVLAWAVGEMERRYELFARARVRFLEAYNEKTLPKDRLHRIVIVVDELADLMMTASKDVEEHICRLAQMARATGIHLILATQRPSVNVVTGLIKANIPARVAFRLPTLTDSRTILDSGGAEKLLGKGDMLIASMRTPKPIRVQGAFVDEHVIARWIEHLVSLFGAPDFSEDEHGMDAILENDFNADLDDDMLGDAVRAVLSTGIASASGLQRRLRVGFSRASRLIDMMESVGIVGPADGTKPREILVDEDEAETILQRALNGRY